MLLLFLAFEHCAAFSDPNLNLFISRGTAHYETMNLLIWVPYIKLLSPKYVAVHLTKTKGAAIHLLYPHSKYYR